MTDFKKKAEPLRVKLQVVNQNWVSDDGDFGIYRCTVMEKETGVEVKVNRKGETNIKGAIPYLLKNGKSYVVYLKGSPDFNQKFNSYTYDIDRFETEQLTLPEEQFEFLATVTTENILKQLEEQYPNQPIIDLIFEDKVDIRFVKGLGEKNIETLKENLQLYKDLGKLQSLLKPLGVSIKSIKKVAQHFGSPDGAYIKLQESMYNMCQVKGFGFTKVDEVALKGGTDPRDPLRLKYCLGYLLEQYASEGHSWTYLEDIHITATDYLKIEPMYLDKFFEDNPYEKGESYDFDDIIVVGDMVSTFGMYWDERSVMNNLDRLMRTYTPHEFKNMDELIKDAEDMAGIKYTDEQLNAIKESLNTGVYIIEGKAGTGKTTIVKAMINILESVGVQTVAVALSGKASQILASKGLNASTIHRALGYDGSGFMFNEDNPMAYTGIEFDEASMANANIWRSLIEAIPEGAKLIVTGDSGQLPAIGAGDIMRDILASRRYPKTALQQVHRQALDSGVIEVALKIREGEQIVSYGQEVSQVFGNNQDLQLITMSKPKKDEVIISPFMSEEEKKEISNPIYITAKSILDSKIFKIKTSSNREEDLLNFQVICPVKKNGALSVDSINAYVQRIYNENKEGLSKTGTVFKKDDKIIVSGNSYKIKGYASIDDYKKGKYIMRENDNDNPFEDDTPDHKPFDLFNGTTGIIKYIDFENRNVIVKFDGMQCLIPINEDDFNTIDLGYAYSIHKSQGSSIDNLLILFDFSAFKLLSKQLVYTALTRTSGKCIMLCENNALNYACKTDHSGMRRTFMGLFLQHLDSLDGDIVY